MLSPEPVEKHKESADVTTAADPELRYNERIRQEEIDGVKDERIMNIFTAFVDKFRINAAHRVKVCFTQSTRP